MKNHNQKHLTLSDRIYIEQELLQGSSFASMQTLCARIPLLFPKKSNETASIVHRIVFEASAKAAWHPYIQEKLSCYPN